MDPGSTVLTPRALAMCVSALARLQYRPHERWLPDILACLTEPGPQRPPGLQAGAGRESWAGGRSMLLQPPVKPQQRPSNPSLLHPLPLQPPSLPQPSPPQPPSPHIRAEAVGNSGSGSSISSSVSSISSSGSSSSSLWSRTALPCDSLALLLGAADLQLYLPEQQLLVLLQVATSAASPPNRYSAGRGAGRVAVGVAAEVEV